MYSGIESPALNLLRHIIDTSEVDSDYPNPSRKYISFAKERLNTPVDVTDSPHAYQVIVDMPGVEKGDVKVEMVPGQFGAFNKVMSILGERRRRNENEPGVCLASERVGRFVAKIILPANAITDVCFAPSVEDGVVTVIIWKKSISKEDKVAPTQNVSPGRDSTYPVLVPTPLQLDAPAAIVDVFENALLNLIQQRHQQLQQRERDREVNQAESSKRP